MSVDREHARLVWRCRRGMKELDLLLLRWLRQHYPAADPVERAGFEALLELPDPELAGFLLGRSRPEDPVQASLVQSIIKSPPSSV